jgi:hypothetical protein
MHVVLTIAGTIIIGALTFAVGQMILRGAIEPALELKRLLATIAFDIDFFADRFPPKPPADREARDRFRSHGYALNEKLLLIIWYSLFRCLLRLPPRENLVIAAGTLVGHSNQSADPPDGPSDRRDEIKQLLQLDLMREGWHKRASGWLRLGVFVSIAWPRYIAVPLLQRYLVLSVALCEFHLDVPAVHVGGAAKSVRRVAESNG